MVYLPEELVSGRVLNERVGLECLKSNQEPPPDNSSRRSFLQTRVKSRVFANPWSISKYNDHGRYEINAHKSKQQISPPKIQIPVQGWPGKGKQCSRQSPRDNGRGYGRGAVHAERVREVVLREIWINI